MSLLFKSSCCLSVVSSASFYFSVENSSREDNGSVRFSYYYCVAFEHIAPSTFRSMSDPNESDGSFNIDVVSEKIKEIVERNIGVNSYQHNKVNRWTADIVDQILNDLTRSQKPFKYIVQAVSCSYFFSSAHRLIFHI